MIRPELTITEVDPREDMMLRARAKRALERRRSEFDLNLWIGIHQPRFREPTHLAKLTRALDASMRGPKFILLEAPSRHGKTSHIQAHCARLLEHRERPRVAWCTYANDVAYRRSREVRELAATAGVWVGEEQRTAQHFDPSKSVAFWQTSSGGSFVAGGRHGQWISEGFDLIVYDDALKDHAEAESQIMRDEAFNTFRGTLMSRREPGCTVVVSMQRWGDDDPIGRIKRWLEEDPDAPEFEVITLRALENIEISSDQYGNERIVAGEPLCPWRYDFDALVETASILGPYFWPNFQQDVTPRGKKLFPELARYDAAHTIGSSLIISCDPGIAGTAEKEAKKKEPDPSGIVVAWAYLVDGTRVVEQNGVPRTIKCKVVQLDIIWAEQLWLEPLDLLAFLEELQVKHYPGAPCLLEEVSAFRILELVAARTNEALDVVAITPRGSKMIRSLPTARSARERRVRVPGAPEGQSDAPWVASFCREVRDFTGKPGRKDNRVDALTQLHDYAELALGVQDAGASSGGASSMGRAGF